MMRVICLRRNPKVYTCNSYLVLGDWNCLGDVNTLVDVGSDGFIIDEIEKTSTGCGKKPVDQVVLTHGHFDHASGLPSIQKKYDPRIYSSSKNGCEGELLRNEETIKMGDRDFCVIHAPIHSNDSICLYCAQEKVLFSGDTPVRVVSQDGSYEPVFISLLERLARMDIEVIYSGHDPPVTSNANQMIRATLANVRSAKHPEQLRQPGRR
jgi:glyoxylase-like metal-dependent hydrolase (beta-lactamase superfamily II)